MAELALYRSWRPLTFDDVVSQEAVVKTLRQAVITGEISHAYLFSGTRGTGKTSTAKILARAVNCLNPVNGNPCNKCEICESILNDSLLDVREIDAASNNSVDNVRRIIDEVAFAPLAAKYKVYIIDEVHMLSSGAFNALLKTLEEPPAHVIFILATTEAYRIPATILSRCQRFNFSRIPDEDIVERLSEICREENIKADKEALSLIASLSDGALRDAISLLDQAATMFKGGISAELIYDLVGSVNKLFFAEIAENIKRRDVSALLSEVAEAVSGGSDLSRFTSDLTSFFRDLLVQKAAPGCAEKLISANDEERRRIAEVSELYSSNELEAATVYFSELMSEMKWTPAPRTALELLLIKLAVKFGSADENCISKEGLDFKANDSGKAAVAVKAEEPARTFFAPNDKANAERPEEKHKMKNADEEAGVRLLSAWGTVLERLKTENPYYYLFSVNAVPKENGSELLLCFSSDREAHYNVVTEGIGGEIGKLWKEAVGTDKIKIRTELGLGDAPGGDKWIDDLAETCRELNVPFKIE